MTYEEERRELALEFEEALREALISISEQPDANGVIRYKITTNGARGSAFMRRWVADVQRSGPHAGQADGK